MSESQMPQPELAPTKESMRDADLSTAQQQPTAKVGSTLPCSAGPPDQVTKVLIAVHGIGDQATYGTIQTVLNRLCAHVGQPSGIPLGGFHIDEQDTGALLALGERTEAESLKQLRQFGFAEVYWAAFPRELVNDKHKLEETRAWARTIVERLRVRYNHMRKEVEEARRRAGAEYVVPPRPDFSLVKQVLGEMILTISVLDRLCFLADKAGIFSFDLRQLLQDYVGDVQVVAEFASERKKILDEFNETMARAATKFPNGKLYIIAHSEGTVVSLLALLKAFREPRLPEWAGRVEGLMTLGSPIDKHLVLWPELFGKEPPKHTPARPIEWHNYYDLGDPVGFDLDGVREWMREVDEQAGPSESARSWNGVFDFPKEHDHGFSRYPFPGKAHVDYWSDDAVFGHFLQNVVRENPSPEIDVEEGRSKRRAKAYPSAPRSSPTAWTISQAVPFAAIAGVLFAAAFVLFKALVGALVPEVADAAKGTAIALRAGGLAALMAGVTAVARIPRLTKRVSWRVGALVAGAVGVLLFHLSATADAARIQGLPSEPDPKTIGVAGVVVLLSFLIGVFRPQWGVKSLLYVAAAGTVWRIAQLLEVFGETHDTGPLWPLVFAVALSIYLWWLGALLLDLVTVWHLYIRDFKAYRKLKELAGVKGSSDRPASTAKGRELAGPKSGAAAA